MRAMDKLDTATSLQPDIAARIQQVRAKRSLRAFADNLGIHQNSQRRYETCGPEGREPPLSYLIRLAAKEQVSLSWLLTGQQQEGVGVLALAVARAVFRHQDTAALPEPEQARIVNATVSFFRGLGYGEGQTLPEQSVMDLVGLAARKMAA
jgi:transcriptional regulator with XRE-family HTH domain